MCLSGQTFNMIQMVVKSWYHKKYVINLIAVFLN